MRVLFLNHVSAFGGASKSLIELCVALQERNVEVTILCPRGKAAELFRQAGLATYEVRGMSQWNDTEESHYKGIRWLVLLRELALWPTTLAAIWRCRRMGSFDLVHANEITLLLPAIVAKKWLHVPLAVHVRSLQRGSEGGRITRWVNRLLGRYADLVVAIDDRVRQTLPADLKVRVVHNSLKVIVREGIMPRGARRFTVAMIGSLLAGKGVMEFLEAAKICRERGIDVEFLLVGDNVRNVSGLKTSLLGALKLSKNILQESMAFVEKNQLGDSVKFAGFVQDVQSIYQGLDVLCFPSYYNAPGRPVFEAAFFSVPSIVATSCPTPDTLVPGETGLAIPGPDPVALADAIEFFYRNPGEASRMGKNAKRLAEQHYNPQINADLMLDLYQTLLVPSHSQKECSIV